MFEDGDQSVILVCGLFVNLGFDNMVVLLDLGCDNCVDVRVIMSVNIVLIIFFFSLGDIILVFSLDQGNEELLFIWMLLQLIDKEVFVKNDGRNLLSCLFCNEVLLDI